MNSIHNTASSKFRNTLALAAVSVILTACGGGGGSADSGSNNTSNVQAVQTASSNVSSNSSTVEATAVESTETNNASEETTSTDSTTNTNVEETSPAETTGTEETPVTETVVSEETASEPTIVEDIIDQTEELLAEETPIVEETLTEEVAETVADATTYSTLLSWSSPDARENGETLESFEIGGFEIKYKNASANSYTTIVVNESNVSEYLIDNLSAGSYEFMIATIDADGIYSEFSEPLTYSVGS